MVAFGCKTERLMKARSVTIRRRPAAAFLISGGRLQASTISGNKAGTGGGIYALNAAIEFCTVAFNTASGPGGGIFNGAGLLSITQSIVAQNRAAERCLI